MKVSELADLISQKSRSGEASEEELNKLRALLAQMLSQGSQSLGQGGQSASAGAEASQGQGQEASGGSLLGDAEAQHQSGDGCQVCAALQK
ncbi:hypothetical protein TRICHSKD4_3036 [Roseibium sp. TrichSKD4]|nr:hypothetical protein TRICHSKD4_3036 [Roseibium sp. TrichSKD4]